MDADNRKPHFENMDRWLETVLRERVNAEPRSGLEERVLARLASRPQQRFTWWQAWAMTAALLVIALTLAVMYPRKQQQVANGQQPATSSPAAGSHEDKPMPSQAPSTELSHPVRRDGACCISSKVLAKNTPRSAATLSAAQTKQEPLPKLGRFPAPRPETTQERLLAQLAAQPSMVQIASVSNDALPLKDLSIPELKIDPMEGTPPDVIRENEFGRKDASQDRK